MRTWIITGAGRGLGREFARAALQRGDRVVATVRDAAILDDLRNDYPERVDVVAMEASDALCVATAMDEAVKIAKTVDVLVNNAGYGLAGGLEEVTDDQIRRQMEVNFFAPLACTRAVLPAMRAQRNGHIIQVSSLGGLVSYSYMGVYHASKWALEGFSETLAKEVVSFGIRVTILEPGPFRTEWGGGSLERSTPMPEYETVLSERRSALSSAKNGSQPGDPARAAHVLMDVVDMPSPPLRLLLGDGAARIAREVYTDRLAVWDKWHHLTQSVDF